MPHAGLPQRMCRQPPVFHTHARQNGHFLAAALSSASEEASLAELWLARQRSTASQPAGACSSPPQPAHVAKPQSHGGSGAGAALRGTQ